MDKKHYFNKLFGLGMLFLVSCTGIGNQKDEADILFYVTTQDQALLFAPQETTIYNAEKQELPTIQVISETAYQEMDGFGYTLTGGSAYHIHNLPDVKRGQLLHELFAWDEKNIGISYLRISLGASDLDAEVFSYDDLNKGETDPEMERFSLNPDRNHLIPLLKEILQINPDIKIMSSPWSPPIWMKTNHSSIGGSLMSEFYDAYALYFVKYVQEMEKEGIPIDAITVQNEPLHPGNNPSLLMLPEEQLLFVKNHLGPAFEKAGINTKIIIYDHNADRPDYPISILDDPDAKKYIDGSAFHLYGGVVENVSQVHDAHPDKNLYFTEQWIGAPGDFPNDFAWHMDNLIIGAPRNWCKIVLEWNLAADVNLEPHTEGGCTRCLGALTIVEDSIIRNPAYYVVAHASKFVRPGSVRIESSILSELPNVAYKTPDNSIVVIVLNTSAEDQEFNVKVGEKILTCFLKSRSAGTLVI